MERSSAARVEVHRHAGLTRRRALALLAVALVLSMATWFSASAVIPQLQVEWGLGSGQAAWLTIAVQLGFVVGALAAAAVNLSDVVAPQRVIVVGALGAAAANALLVFADGPGPARQGTPAGLTQTAPRHRRAAADPQAPVSMRGRT